MATLNIGGKRVKVDDAFLSLSPEQQQQTVDEIAGSMGAGAPQPDQSARRAELMAKRDQLDSEIATMQQDSTLAGAAGGALRGIDDNMRLAANGASFGFLDKALGGDERQKTDAARERQGYTGMVSEIGGSIIPAAGLAGMGATATRIPGAVGKFGGMAIDGAGYGALSAAGNDQNILQGAGIGAGLGAAGQAAGNVLGTMAAPITSRLFPDRAAGRVMNDTLKSAKMTPAQVENDLAMARADGQGVYAVADVLGNPGQRLASTIARTPSEGRAPMVEFLDKRQAGQGRRIANALAEGFDDPATALQKVEALKKFRKDGGDINYGAARQAAKFVDTSRVVERINGSVGKPLAGVSDGMGQDTVSGVLSRVRSMLVGRNGNQRVDFNKLVSIRSDISDMASKAFRAGANKQGAALKDVLRELDASLADASPGYRKALEQYAKDSAVIGAVDKGTSAARQGRFEDTIPAFQKLSPEEQQAYRAGYADPLIAQAQQSAVGVNKARPLINDAFEQEFPAFAAPGKGPQLGARIRREQTMFETRNAALGGSKTVDNLADEAALSAIDPSIIGNVLSGNLMGAAKNAVLQGISALKGQPASVRERLSRALLETNPAKARQRLELTVKQINASDAQKQAIVRALMMVGTTGALSSQR